MKVYLDGIGVLGPGLTNWLDTKAILQNENHFVPAEISFEAVDLLSSRDRRRVGKTTLLAMQVAKEACDHANANPSELAAVFVASAGDLENLDYLCETLSNPIEEDRRLSPTKFHNSVHNASAGYWAIATHCHKAINSLSGGDFSVATGYLEAITQVIIENTAVLLVIYDNPTPPPLNDAYPVDSGFASAWVLQPNATNHSFAMIDISISSEEKLINKMTSPELEYIRQNNPSAQVLPLLKTIATRSGQVHIALNEYEQLNLSIDLLK